MDIQTLLKALDDESIQKKIRFIVNIENENEKLSAHGLDFRNHDAYLLKMQRENREFRQSIERLNSLLRQEKESREKADFSVEQLSKKVAEKEKHLQQAKTEYQHLVDAKDQLESNISELNRKLEYYRNNFHDDLQAFELYNRLSDQTRQSLSGIFKDTTVQGLIACGIQEKNISNLWDYAKSETINGNNGDLANVILLFNLLFKRFTLAYPMFALQNVNSGDSFDTQSHIKHSSSVNTSGSIVHIMLHGYVNTKIGKVIKPSIVKL